MVSLAEVTVAWLSGRHTRALLQILHDAQTAYFSQPMHISDKVVQHTAAKRTQAEMLTTSLALPRARRSEVGDSTSSSLMGSIRVVLRKWTERLPGAEQHVQEWARRVVQCALKWVQ